MPTQDREEQKLKAEIDEIMQRVKQILNKIEADDPGKEQQRSDSGE